MPATGIEPVREYKSRRILSPVRLPVPPRRLAMSTYRPYFGLLHAMHVTALSKVLSNLAGDMQMDGGGFEPPKQFAADLQSVPFGHSGIHP